MYPFSWNVKLTFFFDPGYSEHIRETSQDQEKHIKDCVGATYKIY